MGRDHSCECGTGGFNSEHDKEVHANHFRIEKWDRRFLKMAKLVSEFSKDPSTKCGAVIVRPDLTVASVGFNGFPRGCDDRKELYENRELKYARVVHAELNAILHVHDSLPLTGYTLYTYPPAYGPSCDRCSAHVVQSGISRIVHLKDESDFALRWKDQCERGLEMFREAGITVDPYHYTFIKEDE
jgi:dCMP deaminase